MAARTLTWHVRRSELGGAPGPSYRLEADYEPQFAWAVAKTAPGVQPVIFDVRADGVSIFLDSTTALSVAAAQTAVKADGVSQAKLREGQIVTLAVLQSDGTAGDITVGLELA